MKISPIKYLNNNNYSYNCYNRIYFASHSLKQDSFESLIKTNSKEFQEKFVNMVEPYKNLTLDSDINLFDNIKDNYIYTVPLKYAIMVSNSLNRTGDAHIYQNTPKIFENLDRKKLYSALDKFANKKDKSDKETININSKEFEVEFIDDGNYGTVYLIKDKDENRVVVKVYKNKYKLIDEKGFLAEIPTMIELSRRETKNTPEFYMANAGYYKYGDGKIKKDTPWLLEEYITTETPVKDSKKSLGDFFRETNMTHFDWYENRIGNYFTDMGGVLPNDYYDFLNQFSEEGKNNIENFKENFADTIDYLKKGMSIEEILEQLFKDEFEAKRSKTIY